MAKHLIFYVSILLLLVSCVEPEKVIVKESKANLPQLHIQPALYELGDIKEGEAAIATFLVRNNSAVSVDLVDIQTSCGCTAAEPDSFTIMPGGFTQLRVAVDTTAKQQGIKKTIHIIDSLGNKASALLTFNVISNPHQKMSGKVKGIFDVSCASCHFEPLLHETSAKKLYEVGCAMCHGADAGGANAPGLHGFSSLASLKLIIGQGVGRPQMPGFAVEHGGPLQQKQIHDLAVWLMSLPAESK